MSVRLVIEYMQTTEQLHFVHFVHLDILKVTSPLRDRTTSRTAQLSEVVLCIPQSTSYKIIIIEMIIETGNRWLVDGKEMIRR